MVPAEIKSKLRLAFDKLSDTRIDLNNYEGSLFEVACEIFTSETFVAGIADTLLDEGSIDLDHRIILEYPLILNSTFWVCTDGQTFDLTQDLLLLDLAAKVEKLRQICTKGLV
jgi:hypothetical protein